MSKEVIGFSIYFISIFVALYKYAIFAYILLSWFPAGWTKFRRILARIVEPILTPFKWAKIGNLSFSAIIAFIVIEYLGNFIVMRLGELL